MSNRLTKDVIIERLKDRPIELVTMGRTVNDPYTFLCTTDESHGEWTVTGRNVLYIKSGCPKCWQVRRKVIRQNMFSQIRGSVQ